MNPFGCKLPPLYSIQGGCDGHFGGCHMVFSFLCWGVFLDFLSFNLFQGPSWMGLPKPYLGPGRRASGPMVLNSRTSTIRASIQYNFQGVTVCGSPCILVFALAPHVAHCPFQVAPLVTSSCYVQVHSECTGTWSSGKGFVYPSGIPRIEVFTQIQGFPRIP